MKVLFTAIGKTDPMSIFENLDVYDGSILHICRYYKPDIIYLYMSKQICEFDEADNRYEKSIDYLQTMLNCSFKIIKIKKEKLTDVHKFDYFYDDFEENIYHIIKEYGENTELLLNVSSGTPAMKSALQVIAALSNYRIYPIQVSDPSQGQYKRDDNLKKYNVDEYWKQNLDNVNETNRCFFSDNNRFNFKIQKEMIVNLLKQYDYDAAYNLILKYSSKFDDKVLKAIQFALNRIKLDKYDCRKIQKELNVIFFPYNQDGKIELFEYALWLKIKADKGDLLDVVRGINPFMYEASKIVLKKLYGIDITKYLDNIYLTREKLNSDDIGKDILKCLDLKYKGYSNTFLKESQMIAYIEYKSSNQKIIDAFKELDCFREKLRNEASHQITCIKKEIIQRKLSKDIQFYINCIKIILNEIGYDTQKYWNSYDQMNDYIIKLIKL